MAINLIGRAKRFIGETAAVWNRIGAWLGPGTAQAGAAKTFLAPDRERTFDAPDRERAFLAPDRIRTFTVGRN